ncbi:MAG: glycoside hydrolase family 3 C-terminal domain-containing protein [Bacteroidales bacterium]|nr:glycoside hydrolase family 3 C-terminal domain-containing protein [Candidatus Sodaliphilus aphodohippi]
MKKLLIIAGLLAMASTSAAAAPIIDLNQGSDNLVMLKNHRLLPIGDYKAVTVISTDYDAGHSTSFWLRQELPSSRIHDLPWKEQNMEAIDLYTTPEQSECVVLILTENDTKRFRDYIVDYIAARTSLLALVVNTPRPIDMETISQQAKSIIITDISNPDSLGKVLARTISGSVNPSGRLPYTIAKDKAQGKDYQYYDENKIDVLYPMGYGVGFSSFAYSKACVAYSKGKTTVKVEVTNENIRTGSEVVQIYAESTSLPNVTTLVGASRVTVTAAAPVTAVIDVDMSDMPNGSYKLWVGSSSRDLRIALPYTK